MEIQIEKEGEERRKRKKKGEKYLKRSKYWSK